MSQTLHPRIVEVVSALEAAQEHMRETLADIPAELMSRKPADGGWSVEEIVDHLARIEDGLGRVIGGMLKQLEGTVDTETDPIAPTIAMYNVPEPVRKIAAPERVQPVGMPLAEALAAQAAARTRVIEALRAGSGRALHTQTFPHPFFGPLNGYQWALLNAQHQRRHCVQMRNTVGSFA
ncbi:MAG: DinB family protein [Gemmatimonadetes bacterium]|nr:DinB family protein [Gemmatimonadota bacterium]